MDIFEDELTCSVCYNIFDDPRILPCSHTFCRNCLENVTNSSDHYLWRTSLARLKCPACRATTELTSFGILSLPINFALKSIVEKYKTENYCKVSTCSEHYRQPLNVFCLKDRKLICAQCLTVGQHQGHEIDDPESAYLRERETASKFLRILSDKHFTGVSFVIKNLEEQINHCKSIVQTDKNEVLCFFEKLSETLEQQKQNMLAALNEVGQQVVNIYDPQIEQMKQILDEELDLISLSSSIKEEQSAIAYLENICNIRERMKALKKQQLISVRHVEIYPRAHQLLNDKLLKTKISEINLIGMPKINVCFEKPENTKTVQDKCTVPCVLLLILLFIALILFIWFGNVDTLNHFKTRYWIYLSDIMKPAINGLDSALYTVQTATCTFWNNYKALL